MTNAREQIIQTTCNLMESQGYHATGLNQIVKESGSPKGSLYYYFPQGKEEIASESIKSIAEVVSGRIRENLAAHPEPGLAIRKFCEAVAYHLERSGFQAGGPLTIVAMETATTNERLNQTCQEAYTQMRKAFQENLELHGIDHQAESLSFLILSAVEGGIMLSRTFHSGDPLRQTGQHLEQFIRTQKG